jgi:hypothetical protein
MTASVTDLRARVSTIVVANGWAEPERLEECLAEFGESGDLLSHLAASILHEDHLSDLRAILRVQERLPTFEVISVLEREQQDGARADVRRAPHSQR